MSNPSRYDVVATIKMTLADGHTVVDIDVRREDVTTTNGAYRAIRDQAAEEVRDALSSMLTAHRTGGDVTSGFLLGVAATPLVKVGDLPESSDGISLVCRNLYCDARGERYSATKGDYFMLADDEVMTCGTCDDPLFLA